MPWLVVGLGNPGRPYASNRHNIGFMVADEVASRSAGAFREKFQGRFCKGRLGVHDIFVLEPLTYMNLSGQSVGAAASFFKVPPDKTLVIHDDIDLPFARLRVKAGGGHGGHNGLRSIFEHYGRDFNRIRCGIGRPERDSERDVTGWVLGDFNADQRQGLPPLIDAAADAVELVIRDGVEHAMAQCNRTATHICGPIRGGQPTF